MDDYSKKVLRQYTLDAASILRHSVLLIERGEQSFYRVAAAQLRILLCDTTFRHNQVRRLRFCPFSFPICSSRLWIQSWRGIKPGGCPCESGWTSLLPHAPI